MARNLYDAVMELERLKRESTPEAIRARAAAKAAQLFDGEAISAETMQEVDRLLEELRREA